jgi:hypothetical protein
MCVRSGRHSIASRDAFPLARRLPVNSYAKAILASFALVALAGCKLDLKTDGKTTDDKTASKKATTDEKPSAKSDETSAATDDGSPMWKETVTGEKKKMKPVDLSDAGMKGFTILATVDAKVAKSPGGKGVDVSDDAYGYQVWVHEDPTATVALMKKGAEAWFKKPTFVDVDATSFIVDTKTFDGSSAFYFKGLYTIGGKKIVCETPTSIAPTQKEHAEQIGKACASLKGPEGAVAAKPNGAPKNKK